MRLSRRSRPTTFRRSRSPEAFVPPVWPLISGAFAALLRIGHSVPFPSQSALGPHCSTAMLAMYGWSVKSSAALTTVRLGYLSWFVFMAGVVALLRASGRGRCRWEPAALVLMACVPPLLATMLDYFHPQDLVAMGLMLGGLACARRGWWIWAGVLVGLAFTSQQFALFGYRSSFRRGAQRPASEIRYRYCAVVSLVLVPCSCPFLGSRTEGITARHRPLFGMGRNSDRGASRTGCGTRDSVPDICPSSALSSSPAGPSGGSDRP